jgi:hypothetical protein
MKFNRVLLAVEHRKIDKFQTLTLSLLLLHSLLSGRFPLQKKSDYRPIFILPVFAKAFEIVMFEHMADYLDLNNLILPFQYGF